MPRIHMETTNKDFVTGNFFTLYWRDGKRSVVEGDTIEQAFTAAGYGGGAVAALDWYDNGISETHRWDKVTKKWVRYEAIHIYIDDLIKGLDSTDPLSKGSVSKNEILVLLELHHSIIVDLPNKDQLCISYSYGSFANIGWVKYVEIVYGEFQLGSYGDDEIDEDSDTHHFMAMTTEYFNPGLPDVAVDAFLIRVKTPTSTSGLGSTLDEIALTQSLI